jgi:hypothetical protein
MSGECVRDSDSHSESNGGILKVPKVPDCEVISRTSAAVRSELFTKLGKRQVDR